MYFVLVYILRGKYNSSDIGLLHSSPEACRKKTPPQSIGPVRLPRMYSGRRNDRKTRTNRTKGTKGKKRVPTKIPLPTGRFKKPMEDEKAPTFADLLAQKVVVPAAPSPVQMRQIRERKEAQFMLESHDRTLTRLQKGYAKLARDLDHVRARANEHGGRLDGLDADVAKLAGELKEFKDLVWGDAEGKVGGEDSLGNCLMRLADAFVDLKERVKACEQKQQSAAVEHELSAHFAASACVSSPHVAPRFVRK